MFLTIQRFAAGRAGLSAERRHITNGPPISAPIPSSLLRADERPVKAADVISRVKMTAEKPLDDRSPIARRVAKRDGSDSRATEEIITE